MAVPAAILLCAPFFATAAQETKPAAPPVMEVRVHVSEKGRFVDAGISFHFIFMEKKSQRVFGGTMREQSADIYPGFTEIARATGGIAESSQNPAVSFNRAAAISEDYYLLSYTPSAYSPDGGFRTIAVRVKGGNYTVSNRLGYYAR